MTTSTQDRSGAPPKSAAARPSGPIQLPPESRLARLISTIGRGPAAVGRGLDRLAESRVFPLNYLVRMLSSVWLGIVWLCLIAAYVGLGSLLSSWRADLEKTDLQFFDWWPMVALQVLMLSTLAVVTLRRIRLTIYKLGVWVVHIGVITLVVGCFIYFGGKYEGQVRVYLNRPVHSYYDGTERALYVSRLGADGKPTAAPEMLHLISGRHALPYFHSHLKELGNPLNLPVGTRALAADPALKNLSLKIIGFYPFADMLQTWQDGGPEAALNPVVALGKDTWLEANHPADQYLDFGNNETSIGFIYHPTPEQMADLTANFAGPLGITVRVPKLGITRTYAAVPGTPIKISGTPYTLTPGGVTVMPLLSEGYKDATSSLLMVDVTRQDASGPYRFQRQVLSRYPEISPDFITVDGKPKRIQARVDHDLILTFQDARSDQLVVVEKDDGSLLLLHRKTGGGKVDEYPLAVGDSVQLSLNGMPFRMGITEHFDHAVPTYVPRLVPPQQRPKTLGNMEVMAGSALEMEVRSKAVPDAPAEVVYVPYLQFGEAMPEIHRTPTDVNVPGVGPVRLVFSSLERPLPFALTLTDFHPIKYPGAQHSYADYVSTIKVTDDHTGVSRTMIAQLNAPAHADGLSLFQAAWDGHDNPAPGERFSVLGVGNRPGTWVMVIGGMLVFVGMLFAFYVKPLLLQRRKRQLAAFVARQPKA